MAISRREQANADRQIAALIYGVVVGLIVGGISALAGQPGDLSLTCGIMAGAGGAIYILFFA